jgi:hypothetical protein
VARSCITKLDESSIKNAIRSRIKELLSTEKSPYLTKLIESFAKEDSRTYQTSVQRDVVQIIDSPHGLIGRKQDSSTELLGLRKFCKKHTKAILIGVIVVAVVATVVVISFATAGAAAGPAATAAASAIGATLDNNSSNHHSSIANTPLSNHSIPDPFPFAEPFNPAPSCFTSEQLPAFQPIVPNQGITFNDNPYIPKDPFGYFQQNPVPLYPIKEQKFAEPLPPMTFDPEYGAKLIGESVNPTIGDHLRNFGSNVIHEAFETASDIVRPLRK